MTELEKYKRALKLACYRIREKDDEYCCPDPDCKCADVQCSADDVRCDICWNNYFLKQAEAHDE